MDENENISAAQTGSTGQPAAPVFPTQQPEYAAQPTPQAPQPPVQSQPAAQPQYQPQYRQSAPGVQYAQTQYTRQQYAQPQPQYQQSQQYYRPVYTPELTQDQLPSRFKPLGAWTYFGYNLLFSIPVVGLIFMIVFALSDDNINRRNYARSFFCVLLVAVIIVVILVVLGLVFGGSFYLADVFDRM